MLVIFSFKIWVRCGVIPSFLVGLCSFSVFWSSWPSLGAFWARFWEALGPEGFDGLGFVAALLLLENISARLEEFHGVNRLAVEHGFVMQVRAGTAARVAK